MINDKRGKEIGLLLNSFRPPNIFVTLSSFVRPIFEDLLELLLTVRLVLVL